jgi:hypothetical protein
MRRVNLGCFTLIACLFIFSILSSAAHAQTLAESGRIYGQLLDGTKNNAPLAGQTVTLQVAQVSSSQDLVQVETDAHGNYNFPNLSTDKTLNYAVYIRYQGAQYVSNVITLDTKPVQQLNLTVYDATSNTSKVAVTNATILVHEPNTQKGIITISEFFDFANLDRSTYVGSLNASKGKPDALLFSLPVHAQHIVLGQGFSGYNVIQVDRGFASDAALPPGDTQFAFSFDLPYNSTSYDFSYTAYYPIVSISMLVPTDMQANSALLTSQGVTIADQHPYRLFSAQQLLANQGFHLELNGLQAPATASSPTPLNQPIIWLIVGLLILCAILFVTAFLARLQQRLPFRKHGAVRSHKRSRHGHGRVEHERGEKSDATLRRQHSQQDALLQELLKLDKAYEAGKLPKTEYQAKRAKAKARLRALISEEEAAHK